MQVTGAEPPSPTLAPLKGQLYSYKRCGQCSTRETDLITAISILESVQSYQPDSAIKHPLITSHPRPMAEKKVQSLFCKPHFGPNRSSTLKLQRYQQIQMDLLNILTNSDLSCVEYEMWFRFRLLAPWLPGSINGRSRVMS